MAVFNALRHFQTAVSGRAVLVRQYHGRGLCQPPRRHPVGAVVRPDLGAPSLVHPPGRCSVGSPHPGGRECDSRCPLQGLDCPDRVVLAPSGGTDPLPADRSTPRRLVCLTGKQSAANVLLKGSRPQRMADRRPVDSVGGPPGLRLSAILTHPPGVDQDRDRPLPGAPHSPVLAASAVVPSTREAPGPPPGGPASTSGSPLSTQFRDDSSGPEGTPPDVLGVITQSLRTAGLSRRAAELAAQSRRASTRKVYDCRLRHFFKWCRRRSIRPPSASLRDVGDFLLYLYESGLATATVKNYRSAIAAIHESFPDGSSISSNQAISQLARGMFVSRPPVRKLVPSWDLQSVLSTLAGPPFEPLSNAPLLQLSIKVSFLLAAATSRRRSELHALTLAPGHIRWEPGGVRLVPSAGFLTKNQSDSFQPPDIFVPDLKSFSAVAAERLLCPVRALKWYISRTKPIRSGHHQLFLASTTPHQPVTCDTIARWIVTAIRSVPGGWPAAEGNIHANDVRGVSSSWAFFKESMTTWIMGDSIVANAGKNGDQLPGGCRTIGSSLSGARCADLNSQLRRLIAQKPGSDDTCSPHRDQ
ncbi:uncharacterized protein LOC117303973 [Asterias rubens]|uniref:uncharacterized protein LOC117303973 n=1 Tax=Asterias rubens TaxID=7604 RepID=UPI0014554B99|nr:uncharacterized protein LOC117303973 [Asterias rubens]